MGINVQTELGFIGLGAMGAPMARRLLAAGKKVVVYDVDAEARRSLAREGAVAAESPREVAQRANTIILSLPTPAIVEEVTLGATGLCHGDAIQTVIDASTTGPTMARSVADRLSGLGLQYVDAPVSGGRTGAQRGTLTLMVSCPLSVFNTLQPTLALFGSNVFHVGTDPGLGQTVKIINNLLAATAMVASCEAVVMGAKAGIDPELLLQVINSGSGRNMATADKFPRAILPRTFDIGFATQLMNKDVNLCVAEGERLGVPMWVANSVRQMCQFAASQARPNEDFTEFIKHLEGWAGIQIGGPLQQRKVS